jgi:prepilin peptidase CpaA
MIMTSCLAGLAAVLLVYAAWHDIAARTVPNWLPVLLCGFGIGLRLFDHHLMTGLLIAGFTFVILFAVWLLGAMGGGDVKLWAASVLLIPPGLQPEMNFFFSVVLLGGVLAVLYYALLGRAAAAQPGAHAASARAAGRALAYSPPRAAALCAGHRRRCPRDVSASFVSTLG